MAIDIIRVLMKSSMVCIAVARARNQGCSAWLLLAENLKSLVTELVVGLGMD